MSKHCSLLFLKTKGTHLIEPSSHFRRNTSSYHWQLEGKCGRNWPESSTNADERVWTLERSGCMCSVINSASIAGWQVFEAKYLLSPAPAPSALQWCINLNLLIWSPLFWGGAPETNPTVFYILCCWKNQSGVSKPHHISTRFLRSCKGLVITWLTLNLSSGRCLGQLVLWKSTSSFLRSLCLSVSLSTPTPSSVSGTAGFPWPEAGNISPGRLQSLWLRARCV